MAEENKVNPSDASGQQPDATPEPSAPEQGQAPAAQPAVQTDSPEATAFGQTAPYTAPQQPMPSPEPPAPGQYAAPQQPGQPQQPTQPMPGGYQAQPGQQPPMGYAYQGGYGAPQPPTVAPTGPGSGKALGALICGICAIVFSGTVIPSIILGIVAIVLASQYVKAFGKDGKATGGKVCGAIGIVFSVLALALYIFIFAIGAIAYNDYYYSSSSNPSYEQPLPDTDTSMPTDADEQAAIDAAKVVLDELKNPTAEDIAAVAAGIDEGFSSTSGFESLSDIGVDSEEFAKWLLSDMTYEIDEAFVYSDGTGTVYVDVTTKDYYEFSSIFSSNIDAFLESDEFAGITDEAVLNAKIGELMKDAMSKTTTASSYTYIDVKKVGGTWTVDEGSLEDIAEDIFGIY